MPITYQPVMFISITGKHEDMLAFHRWRFAENLHPGISLPSTVSLKTSLGNTRVWYEGCFSVEDARKIIEWCKERGIEVTPDSRLEDTDAS